MKKVAKRILRFINRDCLNIYLRVFYKRQIKNKFLRKSDYIEELYKQNIQRYWSRFKIKIDVDWHKWYSSRNAVKDVRYIPEDIFYCIIEPFYNRVELRQAYSDKAIHSLLFPEVKRPVTLAKNVNGTFYDDEFNPLSHKEVIKYCVNNCVNKGGIIIKPTIDSGGGRDICFIDAKTKLDMKKEVTNILTKFKKDYIIQELIQQHKDLKKINPQSVNTIRVISFLTKGKVYILSSVLRMGINYARVDNQSAGGISCGIQKNGMLCKFAFDKHGTPLKNHPQGFIFENSIVPSFNDILDIIKREHVKLPHFPIVSWDFAVDKQGIPVLIEYNLRFQEINFHQLGNGPLFGDLTDEVLKEVFQKRLI